MIIHHKHAIAMTTDATINHIVFQIGDPGHRDGDFDALVQSGNEPAVSTTAAPASHGNFSSIDFGACFQVIESANSIPSFHASGSVTKREPIPAIVSISPPVLAKEFTPLDRINHQANIAVPGKPFAVPLITCFIAIDDLATIDRFLL